MMTLALLFLALAFGGACVVAWGCALRRDGAAAPRSGPLAGEARENAKDMTRAAEGISRSLSCRRRPNQQVLSFTEMTAAEREEFAALIEQETRRWPGPVLPPSDAALSGLSRHEAADWTGWRPSYDGEDVDPGKPWPAKE